MEDIAISKNEKITSSLSRYSSMGISKYFDVTFLKFFTIGLVVLLGIIFIVVGIQSFQDRKELERQATYYQIEKKVFEIFEKIEKKEMTQDLPQVFGESIEKLTQLIQAAPHLPSSYLSAVLLAEIYLVLEQKPKALEALRKIQEINHDLHLFVRYKELGILSDLKKWEEFLPLSEQILKWDVKKIIEPEVRLLRAMNFYYQGNISQAKTELQMIVDMKLPEGSLVVKRAKKILNFISF